MSRKLKNFDKIKIHLRAESMIKLGNDKTKKEKNGVQKAPNLVLLCAVWFFSDRQIKGSHFLEKEEK